MTTPLDMTRAFPVAGKLPDETEKACEARQEYEHDALAPLRQRFAARYAEVLDAEWAIVQRFCTHRNTPDHYCRISTTPPGPCDRDTCPRLVLMRADLEGTKRTAYIDANDRAIYVERFAHSRRPWFLWHEEAPMHWKGQLGMMGKCRASHQIYNGEFTLYHAQRKLDRLAARYGWEATSMPDYVKDEVG